MEGATGSGGRGTRFWLLVAGIVLALILVLVNFQKVTIDFIVGDTEAPLALALLIAGAFGFAIGFVMARFRGHG